MSDETTNAPEEGAQESTETSQFTPEQQKVVNSLLANQKREIRAQFADYDDLKKTVSDLDSIRAEEYQRGATETQSKFVERMVKADIESIAKEMRFHNPADAFVFLNDLSDIGYSDESGVEVDKIKEKLQAVATERNYLVAPAPESEPKSTTPTSANPKPRKGETVSEEKETKPSAAAALRDYFNSK